MEQDRLTIREVRAIVDERDRRYMERFEAQEKALELALAAKKDNSAHIISFVAVILSLLGLLVAFLRH